MVILSGPSCIGKSPLDKAISRLYPEVKKGMKNLVLYNSREPRPGETDGADYHFRSRHRIGKLDNNPDFVVMDVRGDLQALHVKELVTDLKKSPVFFEGNPFIGKVLLEHQKLRQIEKISVFISPLSKEEVREFIHTQGESFLQQVVKDMMQRKLLRRTRRQKKELSLSDLQNIERRAGSAYAEMKEAIHFDHVIPNHDGEDSENWDAFYLPVGDARKTLLAFMAVLRSDSHPAVEKWEPSLF